MKVYLVMFNHSSYDSSYEDILKGFKNIVDAENYKTELELKVIDAANKIKVLIDESEEKRNKVRLLSITHQDKVKRISDLGKHYISEHEKIQKEYIDYPYVLNFFAETDSFEVIEIDIE